MFKFANPADDKYHFQVFEPAPQMLTLWWYTIAKYLAIWASYLIPLIQIPLNSFPHASQAAVDVDARGLLTSFWSIGYLCSEQSFYLSPLAMLVSKIITALEAIRGCRDVCWINLAPVWEPSASNVVTERLSWKSSIGKEKLREVQNFWFCPNQSKCLYPTSCGPTSPPVPLPYCKNCP